MTDFGRLCEWMGWDRVDIYDGEYGYFDDDLKEMSICDALTPAEAIRAAALAAKPWEDDND